MIDREVERMLHRLAAPGTGLAEAEALIGAFDGREVAALPAVFRALHDATVPAMVNAAVQVLRRWLGLPLAAALPNALRSLIHESGVPDLNKIAAAGLLMVLDHPIDDFELAQALHDPAGLMAASLADAVAAIASPVALVQFIDALADWGWPRIIELCHDLAATDDPEAGRILGPLVFAPDPDTAIAAIAAIERLTSAVAGGPLAVAARHHPSADVRRQATITAQRLAARTGAAELPTLFDGPIPVNGHSTLRSGEPLAWLSAEGGERRAVLLARRRRFIAGSVGLGPNGSSGNAHESDVYTAVIAADGVVSYAAAERVGDDGLDYIRAQLAGGDLAVEATSRVKVESVMAEAAGLTLAGGHAVTLGYAAWWAWLTPAEKLAPT